MQLTEIIKNFIEQKDTDFAVLINGKWGSGKTFFLKNEIADAIKGISYKISEKETKLYELIYVSLYGITTADELQKRLFLEINPSLKTKAGRVATTLFSKGLQYIGLENSDKDQKELLNIFGGIPKYKILVFDDLERLETDTLNEVLGFINSYTEHQKLKVIIIADEEKIQEKLDDYDSIKEKLIRFTYYYNPDLGDVFPSFVSRYETEAYRTFLSERATIICSLFERGNHKNLRSLRFVLDLFEQVYKNIYTDPTVQEDKRNIILDRLLYFFITYAIEYKKGAKNEELNALEDLSSDLDNPLDRSWFNSLVEGMEGVEEKEPEGVEKFKKDFEKEFIDETKSQFQFFPFLANYIHSGDLSILDLKTVALDIQNKVNDKVQKPEQIALEKLKNCLELNDNEFLPLVEELYGYIKAGVYKLEIYPMVFQNLLNCSINGIENLKVDVETVSLFKEGMDKSLDISKYKRGFNGNIYLLHQEGELLDEVRKYATALNDSLLVKDDAAIAERFFHLYIAENFVELQELMLSEDVQSNPIFQLEFIQPDAFLNKFLQLSNKLKIELLDLFHQFSQRFINYGGGLKKEYDFFFGLQALIDTEITKADGNYHLSTAILIRLNHFLKQTVERLHKIINNEYY